MPVYYFHIRKSQEVIPDEEGVELLDLDTAREEALISASEIMEDQMRFGLPVDLNDKIEIADAEGRVIASVTFGDAIPRNGKL